MQQPLLAELAAVPAELPAAEEAGVVGALELVDPDGAGLELGGDLPRARQVRGVDGGAEAGVVEVGARDHVGFGGPGEDGDDGGCGCGWAR